MMLQYVEEKDLYNTQGREALSSRILARIVSLRGQMYKALSRGSGSMSPPNIKIKI